MKYKIVSYLLQDDSWGCSFTEPPAIDNQFITISEPTELGKYFPTKEEADIYTFNFLIGKGINKENIEI